MQNPNEPNAGAPVPEGFHCLHCGACCRWEGPVRIREEEADRIAEFLKMDVRDFIALYTELLPDRTGLTLTEKPDGSCIFLDEAGNLCLIHAVKPGQCSDFPWKWRFPGWEKECAAGLRHDDSGKES